MGDTIANDSRRRKRQKLDDGEDLDDVEEEENDDDEQEEADDDDDHEQEEADDDDEEDDEEEEARRARDEAVRALREAAAAATADDAAALAVDLRHRFGEELFASIDGGGCTDSLLDMITGDPALLKCETPSNGRGWTPVELCCRARGAAARDVAEELLEFGAEATTRAWALVVEALAFAEGGGGDLFAALAATGLPEAFDGAPALDVLAAACGDGGDDAGDAYFAEVVFPAWLAEHAAVVAGGRHALYQADGAFAAYARRIEYPL